MIMCLINTEILNNTLNIISVSKSADTPTGLINAPFYKYWAII